MNERDREQHGRHGMRHLGERLFGRRDEGRGDALRDDEMRNERDDRHQRFERSMRDTYNPEPQWLQQDRESRENRDSRESGLGRGSYAGTGREWGERSFSENDYGERTNRDFGARNYGQRDEQRMREERDYDQRTLGQYRSGGYGSSNFGAPARNAQQDYRSGYETTSWDEDDLDLGRRRYEPFHVGTGMGLGPTGRTELDFGQGYGTSSGYGSRAGWDLGTHQRDWAGDRGARQSYRGMGPANYKRSDERIRDDIYERLTDSHAIDARSIMVEVNQGNVTLSGTVGERRMRYAAEDLVERIGGVANINNQLRVGQQDSSGEGAPPGA